MNALRQAAGCISLAVLLSCLAATAVPAAAAYQPLPGFSARPLPARLPIDPAALEALVDAEMQRQMAEAYIAGAAVTIVHQGRVLLSKGYGHADIARGRPVDPQRTLFRLGSTTKPFTAAAVMQLVGAGRLDLDADVNAYLQDLQIPPFPGGPVTLRNLLTHTAGFEVNNFGYQVARQAPPPTAPGAASGAALGTALAAHQPARVRPPVTDFKRGAGAAYSNWGVALAGQIVARRSGLSYAQYMQRHLLEPLQMHNSSMAEPLPEHLRADMAVGYSGGDPFQAHVFMYFNAVAPAASLSATAADMGRFMLAQLGSGTGQTVFAPADLAAMHARVLSPDPHVNGAGLGWLEDYQYGRRLLWHSGLTVYFYNELYLLPEEGVGLFVAYNSQPTPELEGALMRRFMQEYFPHELPPLAPTQDPASIAPYTGSYAPTVRSVRQWEKLLTLLSAYRVRADAQGRLLLPDAATGEPRVWLASDRVPGLFRRQDSGETLRFQRQGGTDYLLGSLAFAPSTRLPLWQTPIANAILLGLWSLGFVAIILGALWRLCRRQDLPVWQRFAALAATGYLGLIAGVGLTLVTPTADLLIALPLTLKAGLALGLAATGLSLLLAALCLLRGRQPAVAWLCLGLGLSFSAWLSYWRLLGFHFA